MGRLRGEEEARRGIGAEVWSGQGRAEAGLLTGAADSYRVGWLGGDMDTDRDRTDRSQERRQVGRQAKMDGGPEERE